MKFQVFRNEEGRWFRLCKFNFVAALTKRDVTNLLGFDIEVGHKFDVTGILVRPANKKTTDFVNTFEY